MVSESGNFILQRDMTISAFEPILSQIDNMCPGFLAAVFYDCEGEAIDYHSYLDPFDTRLVAAHIGVILSSAIRVFSQFDMGKIIFAEMYFEQLDSVTAVVADGLFISVIVKSGFINQAINRKIIEVIGQLKKEIDI